MKSSIPLALTALFATAASLFASDAPTAPSSSSEWRSELYPVDWEPGKVFLDGYSLNDFSYAGYHSGQKPLPIANSREPVFDVTEAPFLADPTGTRDSTTAIQGAIEAASQAGGGVVFIPEGVFRISPQTPYIDGRKRTVFHIQTSNLVVRGAGPKKTHLFNDDPMMRTTSIFHVSPRIRQNGPPLWFVPKSETTPLEQDIPKGATTLQIDDVDKFAIGDTVSIREDVTQQFIDSFAPREIFSRLQKLNLGQIYPRKIIGIERETNTLTFDIPVHTNLRADANLRIFKIQPLLEEVGIEHLSIGMILDPSIAANSATRKGNAPGGNDVEDWIYFSNGIEHGDWKQLLNSETSSLYGLHASYLIHFEHVANSWIRDVHTYRPESNREAVHLLSNGFALDWSRQITVTGCHLANTAFVGGGGNGYGISMGGQDCLVEQTSIDRFRRPISHRFRSTAGNVILECSFSNSIGADWHMWLSPANLMDSITVDRCIIEAHFRGPDHGFGTTETVIWNTTGKQYRPSWYDPDNSFIINTDQTGKGYVIGTSGPAFEVRRDSVDTKEPDWVEGVGRGDTLVPQSLYRDQLSRRLARAEPQKPILEN
ncbi:glycosyl hydrolase family 28-related protein [Puniceicoccus vermicola]|uniref:Rhamnogalacturonase A/B/Epimerase-like pectate lyase domain-containing protein n=1 Tax=Puniceicoccus vermicola TaxID=388746 RepID=A0A7X1E6J2_9BACT|nr:glycosyl hydrolase family 28-related protein [Puniceicoccus vermicola]MBC2602737.1 hypothetical protein [Puniceicoccus vermicola]